eukprot:g16823.t1
MHVLPAAQSAVKHRLVRYSSLSLSIAAMAREVRLSATATALFVTIVIALFPPSFHRDILPFSFHISPQILDPFLISHADNQALAISGLVSQCGTGFWRACNIGMLPVALEDLLFHILPYRAGPDGKPLGRKIAKSFTFVSNFVCELRDSAARLTSDSGVAVIMLALASPSSAATNYIARNINDTLFPRRTCSGRVGVCPNQRPGVFCFGSMHLRRLDSRLCPDPSDVRNTDWRPDPHGNSGSAAAGITSSDMARTYCPVWRLYPWL